MHKMLADPVAARSMAWVYGCSLAGIAGSNHAKAVDVYCECCLVWREMFLQRADVSCKGVLPSSLVSFGVISATVTLHDYISR